MLAVTSTVETDDLGESFDLRVSAGAGIKAMIGCLIAAFEVGRDDFDSEVASTNEFLPGLAVAPWNARDAPASLEYVFDSDSF